MHYENASFKLIKTLRILYLNGLTENLLCEITHFIPQTEFVCDNKGEVSLDYIGRFEDLNK